MKAASFKTSTLSTSAGLTKDKPSGTGCPSTTTKGEAPALIELNPRTRTLGSEPNIVKFLKYWLLSHPFNLSTQLPASPKPNKALKTENDNTPFAKECIMAAIDHTVIDITKPNRVPILSYSRPDRLWLMPYAIIKQDITKAYWLLSMPNSFEMPGHITAKALRSMKFMTVAIPIKVIITQRKPLIFIVLFL
jgi:hypothetical protein